MRATAVVLLPAIGPDQVGSPYLAEPTPAAAVGMLGLLALLFVLHYAVAYHRGRTEPGALGPDELDEWFRE